MTRRTKSFTVSYKFFERDTFVTPTSPRCPLDSNKVYKVIDCFEPTFAGDDAICFVEGHKHGITTEYLREATPEEVTTNRAYSTFWPVKD